MFPQFTDHLPRFTAETLVLFHDETLWAQVGEN
jgi:hypothetical protein